jgi:hypothetical protein
MAKSPLSTGSTTPEKPITEIPSTQNINVKDSDSDSTDTATDSPDEFDWSESELSIPSLPLRATRGRWLWMVLMKLAKPIRVLLIGILGTAFFVTPLLVVNLRYRGQPAKLQIHVWSLWLTITWAAGCGTYLVVDLIPRLVVGVTRLFGGQIERMKIQVEVCRCKIYPKI